VVDDNMPGVDSIFTLSILFRNPIKFKIMENNITPLEKFLTGGPNQSAYNELKKTQKARTWEDIENEGIGVNLSFEEITSLIRNERERKRQMASFDGALRKKFELQGDETLENAFQALKEIDDKQKELDELKKKELDEVKKIGRDKSQEPNEELQKIRQESEQKQNELKKEVDNLKQNQKYMYNHFYRSKCFFLSFDVIQKFYGVPNIDGIRIYKGLSGDKEVLLLIGQTTIEKNGQFESHDVFAYKYTFIDDEISVPYQSAPAVLLKPCPPPYPCPPR